MYSGELAYPVAGHVVWIYLATLPGKTGQFMLRHRQVHILEDHTL